MTVSLKENQINLPCLSAFVFKTDFCLASWLLVLIFSLQYVENLFFDLFQIVFHQYHYFLQLGVICF
jgi:hypothetical protein